ncbi:fumarylacetoacetate hydrolase family protein [Alcaligenaceae bacterium]|nr:fumarylacetoacetate hydrolase family protein [Alcaligenaceae bacterium]
MKLLTFAHGGETRLGYLREDGSVLDVTASWAICQHGLAGRKAPANVLEAIELGEGLEAALTMIAEAARGQGPGLARMDALTVLAPIPRPRKNIFCVGRNYREHIIEGNLARGRKADDFPKALELFTKAPTTVNGHGAAVSRRADLTGMLDYEVELAIVIGREGRDIAVEQAFDHVFGYTIVNDITARDLQVRHGQWFKGKSLDGTCPIGPVVALRSAIPDPNALEIQLSVNGELRQSSNTSDMLFSVAQIISEVSAGMTLEPGDIIATGTPSGVGLAFNPPRSLNVGDVISARIEHIGELTTTIS